MPQIERVQRPFWMHQVVEYILGIALVMTAVQQPEPTIPAVMGVAVLLNAAIAIGPAGAFRLVPRKLHKHMDLVVIAMLLFAAIQPWLSVDATGRMIMFGIAIVMFFIWFHSDFTDRADRKAAKAAKATQSSDADRTARDSAAIGKTAGRYVGHGVNSLKRWKDSLGSQ